MVNTVFNETTDRLILAASSVPDCLMEQFLDYDIALRRNYFDGDSSFTFYFMSDDAPTVSIQVTDEQVLKAAEDYDDDYDAALYHAMCQLVKEYALNAGVKE